MPFKPTTSEAFNADPFLVQERGDVIATMHKKEFNGRYAILKYLYSHVNGKLFYVLGNEGSLYVGEVWACSHTPLTGKGLLELYGRDRQLSKSHNEDDVSRHPDIGRELREVWAVLFELFVKPVQGIRLQQPCKEVLYTFKAVIEDNAVLFNLSVIYNLSYRFEQKMDNCHLYFLGVRQASMAAYFDELMRLPFPQSSKMVFLNAMEKEAHTMVNEGCTEEEILTMTMREHILDKIAFFVEARGGRYKILQTIGDFDDLFSAGNDRNVIQLFSHFHEGIIYTPSDYIFLQDVLDLIEQKKNAGDFHRALILDAVTCDNFGPFDALREAGIVYVHYSRHNISTDLAAYTLFEMYTGRIASALGWHDDYLDGTRHLHTIYADIERAHYVYYNLYHTIKLPAMDEKEMKIEGKALPQLLHHLKKEQAAQKEKEQPQDFNYKVNEVNDRRTSNMTLLSIVMYGGGIALGRLLVGYLFRMINNDITVKMKKDDGTEVSISFRNRSEKEIRELLISLGLLPDDEKSDQEAGN